MFQFGCKNVLLTDKPNILYVSEKSKQKFLDFPLLLNGNFQFFSLKKQSLDFTFAAKIRLYNM